ncbi:MAG: response regulator [Phycisphaerae bacterium]|nr:response regulator [Phycisphaerae bacterium]
MTPRVLVVDDLPFMRSLLRDILTGAGMTVVAEAEDGRQALIAYLASEPDIVLLDIVMPVMDGLTALRKLRILDRRARVVMCSALGEQEMIVRAIQFGARDFVVKPFRPERVVSAISKVIQADAG